MAEFTFGYGHNFDSLGICLFCGLCDDPECCECEFPCSRSILTATEEARERIFQRFRRVT